MASPETLESPPPSSDDAGPSPGAVLDDKFRVERRLGAGGMGAVYEVTHLLTKHRRALKLIHPQIAQQEVTVARFFREASAAGRIGNAHIVETFDAGWLTTGEPYLVMELLDGVPLTDRIAQQPQGMDLDEVLEIVAQLGDGVQAAHDAGIVHRDLKPDNVFLSRASGAWLVKVLDFGVSKFDSALATRLTSESSMVGTPAYMSPEQFEGSEVGPTSDVYAMGVIVYEMLTGHYPYPTETLAQLMKHILLGEPQPISDRRGDLPEGIERVVHRMMDPNPALRLGSAAEAIAALQEAAEGQALRHTASSEPPRPATSDVAPRHSSQLALQQTAPSLPPSAATSAALPRATVASTQVIEEQLDDQAELDHQAELDDALPLQRRAMAPSLVIALVASAAIAVGVVVTGLGGPETSNDAAASSTPTAAASPLRVPSATASPQPEGPSSATAVPLPSTTAAPTQTTKAKSTPPPPSPVAAAKPPDVPAPPSTQTSQPIGTEEAFGD